MARRKKKKSNRLFILVLFFICLFTGYQYDGSLSWKNLFNLEEIGSVLSDMYLRVSQNPLSDSSYVNGNEEGTFIVHIIDVGQGDSILLQSLQAGQSTENILIDAGESAYGKTVVEYLKDQNVEKLNAVVATHPHSDHIGGLPEVFEQFEVERVYMPKVIHNTKIFEKLVEAVQDQGLRAYASHSGMYIPMSGAVIQILAPVSGETYEELNNYSIVLSVKTQGKHFILTGDAEKLSELEQMNQGFDLDADVLKVGHHGSKTSSDPKYIEAISPEYAIISCGEDNDYGLPSTTTLNTLQNVGCTILRTDESGTIILKVKDGVLTVLEEK